MAAGVEVEHVAKRYPTESDPVTVLTDVTFALAAGEACAITGVSGCGKSTLLHVLGALDPPTAGTVRVGGRDPYLLREPELARFRNEEIGFVFQEHHLLPQYSVLENVLMPTFAYPDEDGGAESRARELLRRVGLDHRLEHRPGQLSGGEKQRAAVARALIRRPALLLCDEPTGSLDRNAADAVAALLFELHRELANVLVVVTHSLQLAGRLPRRMELMEGRCCEV